MAKNIEGQSAIVAVEPVVQAPTSKVNLNGIEGALSIRDFRAGHREVQKSGQATVCLAIREGYRLEALKKNKETDKAISDEKLGGMAGLTRQTVQLYRSLCLCWKDNQQIENCPNLQAARKFAVLQESVKGLFTVNLIEA